MRELQLALMNCCPGPSERMVPEQLVQVPLWLVYAAEQGIAAGGELREALDEVRGSTPLLVEAAIEAYDAQARRHNDGIAAMEKPAQSGGSES